LHSGCCMCIHEGERMDEVRENLKKLPQTFKNLINFAYEEVK